MSPPALTSANDSSPPPSRTRSRDRVNLLDNEHSNAAAAAAALAATTTLIETPGGSVEGEVKKSNGHSHTQTHTNGNDKAQPPSTTSTTSTTTTPKTKPTPFFQSLLSYTLVLLTLLNFASAAFLELIFYLLFGTLCPPLWYAVRILGVRFGWLLPVAILKWANIRVKVTGADAAARALGPLSATATGVGQGGVWGWVSFPFRSLMRYKDLYTEGKTPRALVMLNHLSWGDSFVLSGWLHAHNSVNGDTCWPIWKGFNMMPVGWIAWVSGCPILGYGKDKDLTSLRTSLTSFFSRWYTKFFLFPEGAVFQSQLRDKSHTYARTHNRPLLQHCLLPKHGALSEAGRALYHQGCLQNTHTHTHTQPSLVDVTLAYPPSSLFYNNPYYVWGLVQRHTDPLYIHMHIRTYTLKEVPWEEEGRVCVWVDERFVEKDQMLDAFYKGEEECVLMKGAVEEGPGWGDVCVDVCVWVGLQWLCYSALWWGVRRLFSG